MIQRFVSGAYVDSAYRDAVKADNRDFLVKILVNGTELNCGVKRLEITKGSCGDTSQFSIGSIFSNTLTAELLELSDDIKNQTITVQVGLNVSNLWRYVNMGDYKISDVKKNLYGATITGYGKIVSNSSGTFTEPSNKTLANIATELGNELGCTVYLDSSIDSSKVITKSMNGLTTYQALQVLTSVVGGFAFESWTGNVFIYPYSTNSSSIGVLSVDTSLMTSLPEVEEQDYSITGVRCVVAEASADSTGEIAEVGYEQGSPINLAFNDAYMTQSLFNTCATNLVGYTYRPGKINLSLGNPLLEGCDVLEVTDIDGSIYTVPCHQIRHIYDGGFRSEIVAVPGTNLDNSVGSVAPLQDFMKNTSQNFVRVESELENLAEGIQYFWHDNDGAHVSTIPQSTYINPTGVGLTCFEVLIKSNQIEFRRGIVGLGHTWNWRTLATYANDGITLGDYASMTSSGIILGDINDTEYQLVLSSAKGLALNGDQIVVSEYATESVTKATTTPRICAGLMDSTSTSLTFTVPLECIIPEGTSVDISVLWANFKIDGTSYFVDGGYLAGGYTWLNPNNYSVSAQVVGTSMTITLTKKNTTFKKHGTSTAVDPYSSITCEIDKLTWSTTPVSRSLNSINKSMKTEITEATEPPEVIEK